MRSRNLRILLVPTLLFALLPSLAAETVTPELKSEEQQTLYALGLKIAGNLAQFDFTEADVALIVAGMSDGLLGNEPRIDVPTIGPKVQPMMQARSVAVAEREKAAGAEFLVEVATEEGAVKTESGMVYAELEPGSGQSPAVTDTVRVHYVGTLRDGSVFDSSRTKNEPVDFPLERVAPCFAEGLQKMKVGGTSKLVCPPELAYGDRGIPGRIPGGAVLVFEVELLEIVTAPAAGS